MCNFDRKIVTHRKVCLNQSWKELYGVLHQDSWYIIYSCASFTSSEVTWTLGLLALPLNLREKLEEVLTINLPHTQDGGCIHVPKFDVGLDTISDMYVFMDAIQIARCSSMHEAWMVQAMSYYVFNMAYPNVLKSTTNFLQRIILNVKKSDTKDLKVVWLLGNLKKTM